MKNEKINECGEKNIKNLDSNARQINNYFLPSYKTIEQTLIAKPEFKEQYGDVHTPFILIEQMLNDLPREIFQNPNLKWLDPCAGKGYYFMVVYEKLMDGLREIEGFETAEIRHYHILENMLYAVEINPENMNDYIEYFSQQQNKKKDCREKNMENVERNNSQIPKLNILNVDFLSTSLQNFKQNNNNLKNGFDIIIGNPPYNFGGLIKVPTQQSREKKNDGKAVWGDFIKHAITLLTPDTGILSMIVPSIWMKPDKAENYDFITGFDKLKIKTFTNTETNKLFRKQAQTPTCYFSLQNKNINVEVERNIQIFDNDCQKYVDYSFDGYSPIPLCHIKLIQQLNIYREKYCNNQRLSKFLSKSMMPSKKTSLSISNFSLNNTNKKLVERNIFSNVERNWNIKTCILENKTSPSLVINESTIPCKYHSTSKIIMAHKMYGLPYYDKDCMFGISNRDNYIFQYNNSMDFSLQNKKISRLLRENNENTIVNNNKNMNVERNITINNQAQELFYLFYMWFLSTPLCKIVFDCTRYRMKYLEKYAFELIPNIIYSDTIFEWWYEEIHQKYIQFLIEYKSNDFSPQSNLETYIQEQLYNFSIFVLREIGFITTNDEDWYVDILIHEMCKYNKYETFIQYCYNL